MYFLNVRNVHQALPEALHALRLFGVERESRNGPVVMFPTPVTTLYRRPAERVLFWPDRDANPFFHLFESLWMIGGRDDVAYLSQFNSNIGRYSDDGETFHGAYGFRWRHLRGVDQLELIIERLRANPDDRRQVVQMFDAELDLCNQQGAKDIPCNLTITFQVGTTGALDMTVFNRSNDLIWGCYGANAVHFSFLQEYVARRVGIPVGYYWQVSVNLHAYRETLDPLAHLADEARDPYTVGLGEPSSPYEGDGEHLGDVRAYPIMSNPERWEAELKVFLTEGFGVMGYQEHFFRKIAIPMLRAWGAFKMTDPNNLERYRIALKELTHMPLDCDWYAAAREWITRRQEKAIAKLRAPADGAVYE